MQSKIQHIYEDRIITEGTIIVPEMKNCSIPLKSTDLNAHIKGIIADVEVRQTFYNDLDKKIEAIYVFPLPHDSTVNSLEIKVGDRIITGEIKEREEARQVYNEAKQDGRKAALLEEERPNLFTMSVSGIEPAQEILVKLGYYETIKYEDSEYEFVFPMTITPRYISSEVTDEERISPPVKDSGENNKRDLHVCINLDAGFEIGNIYSPTHKLHIEAYDKSVRKIELAGEGELPDKDFVLKYASKGEKMESNLYFYREKDRTGTFMLNVTPKFDYGPGEIVKRELLFVLDRSGSMDIGGGESDDIFSPMEQAKDSLKKALRTLRTGDIFNIITFDDTLDILSERSLELNEVNLMLADNFINITSARGGTDILSAMRCALGISSSKPHLRQIVFLTDGAVGNEDFVFRVLERSIGRARIFTFGIGPSVNRYLLDKMAKAGRGNSYFITDPKEIGETMERFSIQTSTPVLSDITIEWEGISVSDTYPSTLPDLYSGQVLQVFGRFYSEGNGKAILKSRTGEGEFKEELEVNLPQEDIFHPAIETIWAKHRIENLLDRQRENPKEKFSLRDEILGLALKYKIITPYTSLVAVEKDDGKREDKIEEVITLKVPLLLPEPSVMEDDPANYIAIPPPAAYMISETKAEEEVCMKFEEEVCMKSEEEVCMKPENVIKPMAVDLIAIEVGFGLLSLVDPNQGAKLLDRTTSVRKHICDEMGFVISGVRFRDNKQLKRNGYRIMIRNIEVAAGEVIINKFLAIAPENLLKTLKGPRCFAPAYGVPAVWITADQRGKAEDLSCIIYDPVGIMAIHITEIIRSHAAELLEREGVNSLLEMLKKSHPVIVKEIYPDLFTLGEIQRVLQNLLREKVSIRDLVLILETLGNYAHITKDIDMLTEYVRQALCRAICDQYKNGEGIITVITLDPKIEDIIVQSVNKTDYGFLLTMDPDTCQIIFTAMREQINSLTDKGETAIILCSPMVRLYVKRFTERPFPEAVVLSCNEIAPDVEVYSAGLVALPAG